MDSNQSRKTSSAFEYFLYSAILAETALAALIYKIIFHSSDFARLRVYFAIVYFVFLAWTIAQLNALHRNHASTAEPERLDATPHPAEPPREPTRARFGLSGLQLAIVVLVFATAVAMFTWALRLLG
jgi:hypothetical protein